MSFASLGPVKEKASVSFTVPPISAIGSPKSEIERNRRKTMSKKLEGKIALITGGSRGIGAAIAKRLAADGANVAITYTKGADAAALVVKEIERAGRKAIASQADATDAGAVEAAVEKTVATFGRRVGTTRNWNPAAGDWAAPQKAATALDRYGHVDEVAALVAFVAGPESSYITGANLTVDGGMNA